MVNAASYSLKCVYCVVLSVWPGADLSPLEFGGKWKLAAHQVEPMFRPLIISVAEMTEGSIDIFVVNSEHVSRTGLKVRLIVHKYADNKACSEGTFETEITAEPSGTTAFMTLPIAKILDR